jgi:hypothetical protein
MAELHHLQYGPDCIAICFFLGAPFMSPFIQRLFAVLMLASASASAGNDAPAPILVPEVPDATITISGGVIALGIGYEWARGTLTYQGRNFPFQVRGMSVMDIGAAKIVGVGEVFNLRALAEFEGNYAGSTFGSAVSHGASLALIKNKSGVIIRARSAILGVRFNFSGNGIRIRLIAPPKANAAAPFAGIHGPRPGRPLEVGL